LQNNYILGTYLCSAQNFFHLINLDEICPKLSKFVQILSKLFLYPIYLLHICFGLICWLDSYSAWVGLFFIFFNLDLLLLLLLLWPQPYGINFIQICLRNYIRVKKLCTYKIVYSYKKPLEWGMKLH